jgi:hypothetical protein
MTISKDVKKEPAKWINSPVAPYGNFGAGQHAQQQAGTVEQEQYHYEPKRDSGAYYTPEAVKPSNRASITDSTTTQDLSESSTENENESETDLMPIELNKGGFFFNWTYPLGAKTGKQEEHEE